MAVRRTPSQYDFYNQLFDEMLLATSGSKRRSTYPRRGKVKHIDIHHMTIKQTSNGGANVACYKTWQTREASAHYGVDQNYVAQFVYDNREAWGNANSKANQEGIIVEHANSTLGPKWEISETTLATSAKLVAGLHITHKLGRPTSTGFGEGGTIRTHQSFYATACPGPYFKKIWSRYVAMVQKEYDNMTKKPAKPTTPTQPTNQVKVYALHWNIAGSDTVNGYGKANGYRGDEVGAHAKSLSFNIFVACEAGQANLRAGINKVLGKLNPWESRAKAIWYDSDVLKNIKGRKTYSAGSLWYLKSQKYGAAFFGEKGGKKFSILEIHTDYRAPAKQAKQVLAIATNWRKDCDALKIPVKNRVVAGDFNWDGTKGDDPFKALDSWGFIEHGNKSAATFIDGRHIDGVLAHKTAEVSVAVKSRRNSVMNLSDHNPVKFTITLA